MVVSCFGEKMNTAECMECIHSMGALPFEGKVDLKNPQHKFWLIRATNPLNAKMEVNFVPRRWYFGREVAENDRKCIDKYNLSKRSFLGEFALLPVFQSMTALRRDRLPCRMQCVARLLRDRRTIAGPCDRSKQEGGFRTLTERMGPCMVDVFRRADVHGPRAVSDHVQHDAREKGCAGV